MSPAAPSAGDLVRADESLERQNQKLRRIADALMRRVEQDVGQSGNAYGLFQRATALEAEVRARTRDLERALDALNRANAKLEAATAEAEAASRAKTRFMNAASHDLLQPLNAAKLFLGSLGETCLSAGQAQIVENLSNAFGSVETMLTGILEMGKLDAPNQTPNLRTLPVAMTLEPIAREFAPIAAAKGLSLRWIRSSALVRTDPVHLRQIVQNLVSNAVRYTETGRVTLGCRRRGDQLRIEVHDTGPGVPVDKISEIFREYHRLETASDGPYVGQGMGLGLAIVERACRLLNHELTLRSPPGGGSCFAVSVPMATAEAEPTHTVFSESLVLVLSADEALRGALGRLLESWDVSVVAAGSPAEAAALFDELGLPPDLALLDRSGLDDRAAEARRAALSADLAADPPIIWVGGEESAAAGLGAAPDAAEPVLSLPIKAHRLRAMVSWRLRADPAD